MRVTLVQADTIWHDPAANRERIAAQLLAGQLTRSPRASGRSWTDLIVLPETFTTGFSNEAIASAETMEGPSVGWMREIARGHDAAVTGSIQIRDGRGVYNRLLFATPDGLVRSYDKRHLFRMAGEHEVYAAGRDRLVVEWRGWRVCPLVCYDLRFPVFSRNRLLGATGDDAARASSGAAVGAADALEYDLLLYVANWPAARHEVWRTLLRARAMENLAYVVGVNRAGTDGNGHAYAGGSAVIDPRGDYVTECDDAPAVTGAMLQLELLQEHRRRFPAHRDADRFTLEP